MTQLNISSKLLSKVARGWHVASGGNTFLKNQGEAPDASFLPEANSPKAATVPSNSFSETSFTRKKIYTDSKTTSIEKNKIEDIAENSQASAEKIVGDGERTKDSPQLDNDSRKKDSPQLHNDEPARDSPRMQSYSAETAIDYPQMVKELFNVAQNRENSSLEKMIPGQKQRQERFIEAENHNQEKQAPTALHSSDQSIYQIQAKDFPNTNISKQEAIVKTDSPAKYKSPAAIIDNHPKKYYKKQFALLPKTTVGESLNNETISQAEEVLPQGKKAALINKPLGLSVIGKSPESKVFSPIEVLLPQAKKNISINESVSLTVSRGISKDSGKEMSAIADSVQKVNTIGDFVGAQMLKANQPAKTERLQQRDENSNTLPETKTKTKSVHIGAINIQVKERETSTHDLWPEPPHYTNHVITEDWDWSCQYGK